MTDNGKRNVKSALCEIVLPVISLSVSNADQDEAIDSTRSSPEWYVVYTTQKYNHCGAKFIRLSPELCFDFSMALS